MNSLDFEELYDGTHNEPDFEKPEGSSRAKTRAVSKAEVKHFFRGKPLLSHHVPPLGGKDIRTISRYRLAPKLLATI